MQKNDRALVHTLQVLLHTLKVETDRLLVVVRVGLDFESRILEDWDVVTPGWGGEVDRLRVRVVTGEESSGDAEGTGTGKGLSDGDLHQTSRGKGSASSPSFSQSHLRDLAYTSFLERLRVLTVCEGGSSVRERAETGNREVFLVVSLTDDFVLGLPVLASIKSARLISHLERRKDVQRGLRGGHRVSRPCRGKRRLPS